MRGVDQVAMALERSPVLGRLDEPSRLALARAGRGLQLAAGALLFRAGDVGDAAFVLLEGELEVRRPLRDGRDVRISSLQAGAVVGEMAVIDGASRSADVLAMRRSELWRVPRAALLSLLEQDAKVSLSLLAELSRRLRQADLELEQARVLDLGARLARLLLSEQSPRHLVAMSQTEMARRLGHSREKVNRKLASWTSAGWVAVTREGVRILDAGSLGQL